MKNNKNLINILFIAIAIILLIAVVFVLFKESNNKFILDETNYDENLVEIDYDTIKKKIENKDNFAIFVYQPMCTTSDSLEEIIDNFQNKYQVSFAKVSFSSIYQKEEFDYLKYYPSFIIFREGEMVDYLDAGSDDDTEYYKNADKFYKWFTKYVNVSERENEKTKEEDKVQEELLENVVLDNVIRADNKVNIYFFYGAECPHCHEEMEFFEKIEKEYGKYYNFYSYEVWHNPYNVKLLRTFSNAMGENITSVPYTIIGEKTFLGFASSYEKEFKDAIKEESKNKFDVYFDKLKGE